MSELHVAENQGIKNGIYNFHISTHMIGVERTSKELQTAGFNLNY